MIYLIQRIKILPHFYPNFTQKFIHNFINYLVYGQITSRQKANHNEHVTSSAEVDLTERLNVSRFQLGFD